MMVPALAEVTWGDVVFVKCCKIPTGLYLGINTSL